MQPLYESHSTHNPPTNRGWGSMRDFAVVIAWGKRPEPIPNLEAKPHSADGTAPGRVWESRTPPQHHPKEEGRGQGALRSPALSLFLSSTTHTHTTSTHTQRTRGERGKHTPSANRQRSTHTREQTHTQANMPTRRNIRRRRRAKTRHAMTHRTHAGEHASRHKHTPRQHGEDLASADAAKGPQIRPHNEPTETHAQTRAAKHTHAANKPTRSPDRATSDKVRPLAYAYSECNE